MSIASNPATFPATPTTPASVVFAIPSGSYSAAAWVFVGAGGSSVANPLVIETGASLHPLNMGNILNPFVPANFSVGPIAATALQLADINASQGSNLNVVVEWLSAIGSTGVDATSFVLILTGSGGGTSPTNFLLTVVPVAGACYDLLMVTLIDSSGVAQSVPAGQQQIITFSDSNSGFFNPPNPTIIVAGQSQSLTQYSNPLAGNYVVTASAGYGPLTASSPFPAPQSVNVYISCSPSDVNACSCAPTRANFRDNIRRNQLGITPPIDQCGLIAGAEPTGENWPDNATLNALIFNAIKKINTESKLETQVNLQIPVPQTQNNGPQFIPLTGIASACVSAGAINTIRRLTWTDNTQPGNTYRLDPTDFQLEDRLYNIFDLQEPAQPFSFFTTGYMLALLPGSQNGGVLGMYAGTAIPQFCSDSDTIGQLPQDYLDTIEYVTAELVCATPIGRRNFGADTYTIMKGYADAGIKKIATWAHRGLNETYQKSVGFDSYRFPTGRTSMAFRRRR